MKKLFLSIATTLVVAVSINAQETITCARAVTLMPAQEGSETSVEYIVVGYVTKVSSNTSPSRTDPSVMQQRFYIDDNKGSKETVNCYWCDLPTEASEGGLNVGDKVSVKGKIINYGGKPELKNAPVTIIESANVNIETHNVTVCEAIEEGSSLNVGDSSDDMFKVFGRLSSTDKVNNYGQHTFDMFCGNVVFRAYLCRSEVDLGLGVGDSVSVTGKLYNYNGMIEISNGKVELVEKTRPNGKRKIGEFYYNLNGTNLTAEVTDEDYGNSYHDITSASIPSVVTCDGYTYDVTSIGLDAFLYCSGLMSVTIPNSVTKIGDFAFGSCTGLTSVIIPNSVTSIGYRAFDECSGLVSVTIGDNVVSIGDYAFGGCTRLTSVNIPNSVINIGDYAFSSCGGLMSPIYNSHIFAHLPLLYSGAYNIPEGIQSIAGGAFSGCYDLTTVIIPNSVTVIGNGAFKDCRSITSIVIPDGVISIGDDAFSDCDNIMTIAIPQGVTNIGTGAFRNIYNVEYSGIATGSPWGAWNINLYVEDFLIYPDASKTQLLKCSRAAVGTITIPNSVISIEDMAFERCTGITGIAVGKSVTSIGTYAFYGCSNISSIVWNAIRCSDFTWTNTPFYSVPIATNITSFEFGEEVEHIPAYLCKDLSIISVVIPNSVISIGDLAFDGCTNLTSVTMGNNVTSIGRSIFWECEEISSMVYNSHVFAFMPTSYSGHYDIPEGITSIASAAFLKCDKLTSLSIPSSVTSIGDLAFGCCRSMTSIYNSATRPQTIDANVFIEDVDCPGVNKSMCKLYVPKQSVELYQAAEVWKDFLQIEAISTEDGVDDVQNDIMHIQKLLLRGQVVLENDGKTYTIQGQEMR